MLGLAFLVRRSNYVKSRIRNNINGVLQECAPFASQFKVAYVELHLFETGHRLTTVFAS